MLTRVKAKSSRQQVVRTKETTCQEGDWCGGEKHGGSVSMTDQTYAQQKSDGERGVQERTEEFWRHFNDETVVHEQRKSVEDQNPLERRGQRRSRDVPARGIDAEQKRTGREQSGRCCYTRSGSNAHCARNNCNTLSHSTSHHSNRNCKRQPQQQQHCKVTGQGGPARELETMKSVMEKLERTLLAHLAERSTVLASEWQEHQRLSVAHWMTAHDVRRARTSEFAALGRSRVQ